MKKKISLAAVILMVGVFLGVLAYEKVTDAAVVDVQKTSTVTTDFSQKLTAFTSDLRYINDGTANRYKYGFYSSQDVDEYIYFTFNDTYDISAINIWFSGAQNVPEDFSLSIWTGYAWTEVGNETDNSGTGEMRKWPVKDVTGTALRFHVTRFQTDKAFYIYEFEIKGTASGSDIPYPPTNVALNTSVDQIKFDCPTWAQGSYPVTELVDGKAFEGDNFSTTEGLTVDATKEVYLALNEPSRISEIVLYPAVKSGKYNGGFPQDYRVCVWDGNEWVEVASKTDVTIGTHQVTETSALAPQRIKFSAMDASAIRVIATKQGVIENGGYALRLGEIEVMGTTSDRSNVDVPNVVFPATNVAPSSEAELSSNGESVTYTFDKAYKIHEVIFAEGITFPTKFNITVWDGSKWHKVESKNSADFSEGRLYVSMEAIDCRALCITSDDENQGVTLLDNASQIIINGVDSSINIKVPGEIGTNAAFGGTVIMNVPQDVQYGIDNPGTELVDGIVGTKNNFATTRYQTDAATEEAVIITFAENKAYALNKIKLFPRVENNTYKGGFPDTFKLSVWDGVQWVEMASMSGYTADTDAISFVLDSVVANAVKIEVSKLGTADNGQYVLQLAEVEAWGIETTVIGEVEFGQNAAFGGNVEMNVPTDKWAENFPATELVDNVLKTNNNFATTAYAKVAGTEESITVTFKDAAAYEVDHIKLFPRVDGNGTYKGGFPEDFAVSVWNGTEWIEVADVTGHIGSAEALVLDFATPIVCNMVKVDVSKMGVADNGQYVLQLAEIQAWGEKSDEVLELPKEPVEEIGTNAALNGTVQMNVPKEGFGLSFPGSKLTDGATKGNSFATTAYIADNVQTESITVVFKDGAASQVDNIKIYPRVDKNGVYMGGFPEDFKVSVWDGTKWVEVASKTGYKGSAEVLSLDITPTICNAIKVDVTKFGVSEHGDAKPESKYVLQLAEIEAYGESSNAKLQTPPVEGEKEEEKETGTNAALNGIVQFAVPTWGKNFPATMVVDGITAKNNNFTTSEYSKDAKTTETIMVAFKEGAYEISKIKLFPRAAGSVYQGGFPEDFKVSVWNGTKWVEVASKTGYKSGAGALSLSIDKIVCNAVKVEATKLGASDKDAHFTLQLAEIEAWGEKSSQKLGAAPVSAGDSDGAKGEVTIDNERNLALNRPVYASSDLASYNAPISKVNDGNIKSYWASNDREFVKGEAQWAMVNLLNNFSINTVILGARQQALGFPIDFTIEVFYDGVWKEVVSEVGFVADEKAGYTAYEFKFPGTIGNKVRVSSANFRKVGTSNSMVLSEIAVYGDSVSGNYVLPNENMLTPGALITASTSMEDYDYYIKHLIDGNFATGWSTVPSTDSDSVQFVEIDMQGEVQLSEIQLKPSWGGHGFPIDFTISVYENGEWVDVYEAVDYEKPEDEAIQRFQFETKKVTKFKITVTKMDEEAGLYVWKMNEILAYPSHTGDEFDPNRVEEVISALQFESAEVIEEEAGFFESIQVWKLVAGGVLLVLAIGGCVAVVISGKKKKQKEEIVE